MYKIVIKKTVLKFLEKHKWEKLVLDFENKIGLLAKNPYRKDLDIKALSWEDDTYRLRVWKYRFLYEINDTAIIIVVLSADSRWWIYKR